MNDFNALLFVFYFVILFQFLLIIITNRKWLLVKCINCLTRLIVIFGGKKALEEHKDNINYLYDLIERKTGILNSLRNRIVLEIIDKDCMIVNDFPAPAIEGFEDITHLMLINMFFSRAIDIKAYTIFFTSKILTFNSKGESIKEFDKIIIICNKNIIPSIEKLHEIKKITCVQIFDTSILKIINYYFSNIPIFFVFDVYNKKNESMKYKDIINGFKIHENENDNNINGVKNNK